MNPDEYRDKFFTLLNQQNGGTTLQKILLIDRIATFEMERNLKVIPSLDQSWYCYLSRLLTHLYLESIPGLTELLVKKDLLLPLALHHGFRHRTEVLLSGRPQETAATTLQYIEVRKRLWSCIECLYTLG